MLLAHHRHCQPAPSLLQPPLWRTTFRVRPLSPYRPPHPPPLARRAHVYTTAYRHALHYLQKFATGVILPSRVLLRRELAPAVRDRVEAPVHEQSPCQARDPGSSSCRWYKQALRTSSTVEGVFRTWYVINYVLVVYHWLRSSGKFSSD